ncbi:unnamed protein product [Notodromas monacha]|uniref:Uncharacterized protein n=1 Tax=Notodromas monacha TaxID=399045 RepID=A0A7R9BV97_9CRUS|nr:unnamed protein product [Notodromas monacha]CAG0922388.1 unnamed protein product [Notodromas monacha]
MSEGQEVHPAFYPLFAVPGILVGLVLGFQQWRCHADVPMVLQRFRESLKKVEANFNDEIGQLTEEAIRVERRLKTGEVVAKNYENYLYVNEVVSEVDAETLGQLEAELDEVTAEFSGLLARPTKMKESFILEGNGDSPAATSDQADKNSAARRSYVATIRSHLKVVSTAGC